MKFRFLLSFPLLALLAGCAAPGGSTSGGAGTDDGAGPSVVHRRTPRVE